MNQYELEPDMSMRVDSCQRVIHDVSERLSLEEVNPRIKYQLKRLDELLSLIDHQAVREQDILRIERSTNLLMKELRLVFTHQKIGALYEESIQ
ncbi:hypothetical protein [Dethiosulfatarculus sandiegensis]|uniref:Uncharacterized protein n=1 Tax=Dethiosulfatarculus sandiegensis TaxID=1429043 RepID=A0A0D2HLY9_9BACT|nr:hypothetical protein [Dethiosulfatarculus sandiegensis]KIX11603.1 hypothetical protein X474_25020 [Dethiosulfatarculus sandiegensis]